MAFTLDLTNLKRLDLGIDDANKDANLARAAVVVQKRIEKRIGPFDSQSVVWNRPGTDTGVLALPAHFRQTFREITEIAVTADGTTYEAMPADSWVFLERSFIIKRNTDFAGTITSPDTGNTFPKFDWIEKPIRVTFTCGWDDATETVPDAITDAWTELTKIYYQNTPTQRGKFEPLEKKSKKLPEKIMPANWFACELERHFPIKNPAR